MGNYDYYFSLYEYSYPYKTEPIIFYHQLRESSQQFVSYFIRELGKKDMNKQQLFFLKVKRDINERMKYVYVTIKDLTKWCNKYNISYDNIISIQNIQWSSNELMKLLSKEPSRFREKFEDDYNPDEENLQKDFYNYWYGHFLRETLVEIENIEQTIFMTGKRNEDSVKEFPDYLICDNKTRFAEELRELYKGKKGKDIALLISDLTHRTPQMLALGVRENAQFYRAMENYFGESVGSPQSINNYLISSTNSYNQPEKHKEEIKQTKSLIDNILL